ncbi:MAG: DUF1559 domain-containing protein [Pirellulaceae bacterium]|nr:DUF1559 domain-containing protein [Pirellulaceae bacterium]
MSTSYDKPMYPAPGSAEKKSNVVVIVLIILAVLFVVALCVIGLLVALLLPAVAQARSAAQRAMAQNSAHQITLALLNYEAVHGKFPAAQTTGDGSKPLMSWRVEILPFLEESSIYEKLQREQAWNGPANLPFTNLPVRAFTSPRCPDTDGTNRTAFVAVVGPDTVLRPDRTRKMREIADGASNTAMLMELFESDIAWAEPRDISVEEAVRLIQSCPDQRGLAVAMADGSVQTLPPTTSEETIIKMFNCSDGAASPW